MLELVDLSKSYGGRSVLAALSHRFEPGEFVGVMGPNGNPDVDIDGNIRAYVGSIGASEFSGPRNPRLLGSYVIDPTSGTYPSLSKAIQALNATGVDGAVDFYMMNGTDTTSYPIVLVPADGMNSNSPVTIHPAMNGSSSIVGTAPFNALNPINMKAVIVFDSAVNNVTIDGQNGGNNSRRSLLISNNTAGFANSAVLMTNGASSNTVRNSVLTTLTANRTIQPTTDGWGVMSLVDGANGYGGPLTSDACGIGCGRRDRRGTLCGGSSGW